ncbi:uncharacterized protein LOC117606470 [Osmia lignaria lignaria]|uniref:uncharacterized protein LOC117606470 n=2 Tax=Osmia lignaria TaxID=473952 RepID=UPI0014794A65|nr:trichohyalin-like isoform X1 [Osmia lignaria]XP_034184830.1 trichohyalin-like isoform X1 [Osmia lignaria]
MGRDQRYLEEQLQRRESEVSELRRNHRELEAKFFQLERAFQVNLELQNRQEVEFNRVKLENQELREINDETLRVRTELNSRLMNATIEKDHWKNAFLQQKELINSNNIERNNTVAEVKRECEDILKTTRETAEKQFQELVELYNGTKEKLTRSEEEIGTYESSRQEYENRTFELANLLETLKRFEVDVSSVCQLVAEALKNLTEQGNVYEESMKNLRHLVWTTKDRKDEPELILLRKQNSVLRELVKSLKRKFQVLQETHNETAKRANEQRTEVTSHDIEVNLQNCEENLPKQMTLDKEYASNTENHRNSLIKNNNHNFNTENDAKTREPTKALENYNRRSEFDIESSTIDKSGRLLHIESHTNGVLCEEYILKLSKDREIKIKYPVFLNNSEIPVKIEFVDDENEYEKTLSDGMVILFKHIYAFVNVKQTGIPCSTQTAKTKTINNFAQTAMTGINSFSRLNVGATVPSILIPIQRARHTSRGTRIYPRHRTPRVHGYLASRAVTQG